MKRTIYVFAALGAAVSLAACQQQADDTPAATGEAADINVTTPPDVNVTTPPDVNINPPDVNVNPPNVDVTPDSKTTTESTTVNVPGVGTSTTTTTERK